ncbi:MAG: hypothetical protein L0271_26725 [Gemmatimonadetes bacterium]|nr:hypothetical protein [Gemmatimonadota bacterium]
MMAGGRRNAGRGDIPAPDIARHAHNISLNLWLRGGKLQAQASVLTTTDAAQYALTSYVELTKHR